MMRTFVLRTHRLLGLITALPLLAWASSGLLYAWPQAIEGERVEAIDAARVTVGPAEALARANEFAGRELPVTAITLLMREGRPVYQAVGGLGADSLLIDANTGAVVPTPPPRVLTRYFRQAHFYFFAGRLQVPLLVVCSALACFSAFTGIYLNVVWWRRRSLSG
jgi:uncharacterized iron-regulated membrane protein